MTKSVTKSKRAELSLKGEFSIDNIPEYLDRVNQKIEEIESILDKDKHPHCVLLEIEGVMTKGEKGREEIIERFAQILRKEDYYKKSCKELGIRKTYKFKGLSMKVVKEAFKSQMNRIELFEQRSDMLSAKSELEKYVSEDHKAKVAMQNLAKILGEK